MSKMTDYAVVLLSRMAGGKAPGTTTVTAAELSIRTGIPAPTVAKILKKLAKSGLVQAHRGASGGYGLVRMPSDISVAAIITAVDGPIALTDCVDGQEGACGMECCCSMRGRWDKVNSALRASLETVTLADMTARS